VPKVFGETRNEERARCSDAARKVLSVLLLLLLLLLRLLLRLLLPLSAAFTL